PASPGRAESLHGSPGARARPPEWRSRSAGARGGRAGGRGPARAIDWPSAPPWPFEPLDEDAFPAVSIARRAGEAGGTAPAAYNAANEGGGDAFMAGRASLLARGGPPGEGGVGPCPPPGGRGGPGGVGGARPAGRGPGRRNLPPPGGSARTTL